MNLSQETREISNVCISSTDSGFVFGPADRGEWQFLPPACGMINCPPDLSLADKLRATMHSGQPVVHIAFECAGEMFHGNARIISLEPRLEFEVEDRLMPA